MLQPSHEAPLPRTHEVYIHDFGIQLSPGNFRRGLTRLVSYYALFE